MASIVVGFEHPDAHFNGDATVNVYAVPSTFMGTPDFSPSGLTPCVVTFTVEAVADIYSVPGDINTEIERNIPDGATLDSINIALANNDISFDPVNDTTNPDGNPVFARVNDIGSIVGGVYTPVPEDERGGLEIKKGGVVISISDDTRHQLSATAADNVFSFQITPDLLTYLTTGGGGTGYGGFMFEIEIEVTHQTDTGESTQYVMSNFNVPSYAHDPNVLRTNPVVINCVSDSGSNGGGHGSVFYLHDLMHDGNNNNLLDMTIEAEYTMNETNSYGPDNESGFALKYGVVSATYQREGDTTPTSITHNSGDVRLERWQHNSLSEFNTSGVWGSWKGVIDGDWFPHDAVSLGVEDPGGWPHGQRCFRASNFRVVGADYGDEIFLNCKVAKALDVVAGQPGVYEATQTFIINMERPNAINTSIDAGSYVYGDMLSPTAVALEWTPITTEASAGEFAPYGPWFDTWTNQGEFSSIPFNYDNGWDEDLLVDYKNPRGEYVLKVGNQLLYFNLVPSLKPKPGATTASQRRRREASKARRKTRKPMSAEMAKIFRASPELKKVFMSR